MKAPTLEDNKCSLSIAEYATGIVYKKNLKVYLNGENEDEVFQVFDNFNSAKVFSVQLINSHTNFETNVFNHKGEYIATFDITGERQYKLKNDFLTNKELQNFIENSHETAKVNISAELLLSAINDYPKENLTEPEELILELRKEVNEKLTYDSLSSYLNKLNIDKDAWKVESISSLLEMFENSETQTIDKNIELEKIIKSITDIYRKSNANI